jgi:hypothetical protein
MVKLSLIFSAISVFMAVGWASAQDAASRASGELRLACREAARKVCQPGLVPDFPALSRCLAENKDKLPTQCAPVIEAFIQRAR